MVVLWPNYDPCGVDFHESFDPGGIVAEDESDGDGRRRRRQILGVSIVRFGAVAVLLGAALCVGSAAGEAGAGEARVRFAQFNIWELSRPKLEELDSGSGANSQLSKAAAILQHVRPDVLLVNEIDFDPARRQNARLFGERYLEVSQDGQPPLSYPFVYFAPVNTGVPTGLDLDNDGEKGGPGDAQGFGRYPGQYGMALYSRFPIDEDAARTFRKLRWRKMPDHKIPDGCSTVPRTATGAATSTRSGCWPTTSSVAPGPTTSSTIVGLGAGSPRASCSS